MQSNRRGQAQSALSAVKSRHAEIQKIEEQIEELARLFEQMNDIVIQQEAAVQQIDTSAQQVETDVAGANVELGGAVVKARAARKKKWICLGIVGTFRLLPLSPSAHASACDGSQSRHVLCLMWFVFVQLPSFSSSSLSLPLSWRYTITAPEDQARRATIEPFSRPRYTCGTLSILVNDTTRVFLNLS